eukprot:c9487_g1_i1.p1 GENE.c9487_g1_i1~~c9487_g1_i1.p1  ORF type:complete len:162 (-),score=15.44 c9487_g1_i1:129-614(-)
MNPVSRSNSISGPSSPEALPKSCLRTTKSFLEIKYEDTLSDQVGTISKSVSFSDTVALVDTNQANPDAGILSFRLPTLPHISGTLTPVMEKTSRLLKVLRFVAYFAQDSLRRSVCCVIFVLTLHFSKTRGGKRMWKAASMGMWSLQKASRILPKLARAFIM